MFVHGITGLWVNTKAPRVVQKSEITILTEFAWFSPTAEFYSSALFHQRQTSCAFHN